MPLKRKLPSAPVPFAIPTRFASVEPENDPIDQWSAPSRFRFDDEEDFMSPVREAVYPQVTPVQNRIRDNHQQSYEKSAQMTTEIYFHLTKKADDLAKKNREQEEELNDIRQRLVELEIENAELKKKLKEPRKGLAKPTMV